MSYILKMEKLNTNTASVFINTTLAGTLAGTFYHTIDVPFKTRTVTVSNISYVNDAGAESGLMSVKTNLMTSSLDGNLFIIHEGAFTSCSVPMTFNSRSDISGQIEFQFSGPVARSGNLAFALTFSG